LIRTFDLDFRSDSHESLSDKAAVRPNGWRVVWTG